MDTLSTLITTRPKALYKFTASGTSLDLSGNGVSGISLSGTASPLVMIPSISGSLRWTSTETLSTELLPSPTATYVIGVSSSSARDILTLGSGLTLNVGPKSITCDVTYSDASTGYVEVATKTTGATVVILNVDEEGIELRNLYGDRASIKKPEGLSYASMASISMSADTGAFITFFAMYDRKLSEREVYSLKYTVTDFRQEAMRTVSGDDFRIETSKILTNDMYVDKTWRASVDGVNFDGTDFTPSYDSDGLTLSGYYEFTLPVVEHYGGVIVDWELGGGVVEYSLDGSSYTPIDRGEMIGRGTQMNLPIIKVSFASGSGDELAIRKLRFKEVLSTASATPVTDLMPWTTSARPAYFTGELQIPDNSSPNFYPANISTFGTGGTLTIEQDTDGVTNTVAAVDFWYTPNVSDLSGTKTILNSGETITVVTGKLNFSGFSTVYVNASTVSNNSFTFVRDVPYHIVAVYSTAANDDIVFGHISTPVLGTISRVGIIYNTPNQSDVDAIYDAQQGNDKVSVSDTSTLSMTENAVNIYEFDWTAGAQ